MSAYETREDVVQKINWEGGTWDALEYGLRAADMPDKELEAAWAALEAAFADAQEAEERVYKLLPEL